MRGRDDLPELRARHVWMYVHKQELYCRLAQKEQEKRVREMRRAWRGLRCELGELSRAAGIGVRVRREGRREDMGGIGDERWEDAKTKTRRWDSKHRYHAYSTVRDLQNTKDEMSRLWSI
jgi:hypothetical protein